jgi:hypothetical protein
METVKLILEFVKVLVWPIFATVCVLMFRKAIAGLIPRVKNAELPGGVKIDFGEVIKEARQIKESILAEPKPLKPPAPPQLAIKPVKQTEANARMLALGLQPSPSGLDLNYYRAMVEDDPNLALAGMRMELEILARNLARGFHVALPDNVGAMLMFRKLLEAGAISDLQFQLLQKVIQLCNAAVHGQPVTKEEANSVIELTKFLADDYIKWLSWGFPGKSQS